MRPEELRIGNLIYNGIGEVIPVTGVTISYFSTGQSVLGTFKPIALTEEWLERFGLDTRGQINHILDYEFVNGILTFYAGDPDHYQYQVVVEYVHTLQNAWSVLVDEELTLKQEP